MNLELIKKYKIVIISLAVAVVAYAGYALFLKTEPEQALSRDSNSTIDTELLALLRSLQSLQLNGAILTSPAFMSLVDFSVELRPEEVGRENSFAPLETSAARND